jgi:Ni/Fe-hydrogenase 1 B-type cytochrome subunit
MSTAIERPPKAPPGRRWGRRRGGREAGVEGTYALELPVRLAHWTIVACLVVLSATGWWIARADLPAAPAVSMQAARFAHILSGWILFAAVIMRVVWLFTGNRYASWREWIPTSRARLREAVRVLRFYAFIDRRYPPHGAGHNPLAGLSYAGIYVVLAFMVLSGLALEGAGAPGDWHMLIAAPVAWIPPTALRLLHHLGMWVCWIFVVIHVAIATLVDVETRGNVFGAIVSGWRAGVKEKRSEGEAGAEELV